MSVHRAAYAIGAWRVEEEIADDLPSFAVDCFRRVKAGDPEAVRSLVCDAHNSLRGYIAFWLYLRYRAGDASQEMLREALSEVWNHDHDQFRGMHRGMLRAMFRHAAFPAPEKTPPEVCIWRGTAGVPVHAARRGVSWTTARNIACWFATTYCFARKTDPLVLRTTVSREKLAFLPNDRNESEVICFDAPNAEVDGQIEDWQAAGAAHQAMKNISET
jgi:hypothetical protein